MRSTRRVLPRRMSSIEAWCTEGLHCHFGQACDAFRDHPSHGEGDDGTTDHYGARGIATDVCCVGCCLGSGVAVLHMREDRIAVAILAVSEVYISPND